MKKLIAIVMALCGFTSNAQDLEAIVLAANDASELTENYINPVMKGLMYNMNSGWYTTAKTHKKFGFDITININASFVPSGEEVFQFMQGDYEFLSLPNGETNLPTVMSDNDNEFTVDVSIPVGDGTFKVASFEMPGGITGDLPINGIPTPMIQAGLGLPYKTDLKVRFIPNANFDNSVETSLVGIGVMHDLTQYLGPIENLPFSLSVLGAFTNMKVSYAFDDQDTVQNVSVTNGEAEFKMNTWTLQALASLDFKIVTLYGGLGYNNGSSTIKLKGQYDLTYDLEDSNGANLGTVEESINNPVNLDFEANGMRATVGARLNLAFFKMFADYTIQEYNTANVGIAFSFR
jgi:hypothetical protein